MFIIHSFKYKKENIRIIYLMEDISKNSPPTLQMLIECMERNIVVISTSDIA
jgi:hypothetical protein